MGTAISYRRVSSEHQVGNYSLQTQCDAIHQYAEEHDLQILKDFAELGVTGTCLDRPALNELREFIKNNRVDVVICYDPDRLSRRFAYQMLLTVEFEQRGIELAVVKGEIGDTPEQKLLFNMRGVFAEYELTQILERTLRGRRARIKSGKLANGKASYLYGYQYIPGEGKRVIDTTTSKVVGDIYRWFTEEGLPIDHIIYRLQGFGILSPSGKGMWARASVWGLLKRQAYISDAFSPQIISQEIYDKAQVQLKYNREMAARNVKREYLLRGHLFCRYCGRRYQGAVKYYQTKDGRKEYQYYRCSAAHRIYADPCHNPAWRAKELDNIVWREVEATLCNPQTVMAGIEAIKDDGGLLQQEIAQVAIRLKEIDNQQEQLLQWALKGFPEATVITENQRLNQDRLDLQQRQTELESRIKQVRKSQIKLENIREAFDTVRANLGKLSFEERRLALSALGIRVRVDKDTILIEGNIPMREDAIVSTPSWRSENNIPTFPFSIPVACVA